MATVRGQLVGILALGGLVASGCAFGKGADGFGTSGPDDDAGGTINDPSGYRDSGSGGCSSDLHSVVDGNGQIIQTCPPDQACSNGKCIGACSAAAANKGNVGCDFMASTPIFALNEGIAQPCYAAFVSNNWATNVAVKVSYGGQPLDVTQFARIPDGTPNVTSWPSLTSAGLPPNQVAVLFLSSDPASVNGANALGCVVPTAVGGPTELTKPGRGKTFHIETDYPVSAYDIFPFGGAKSFLPGASMLLPTSAWGKNYVAALPYINQSIAGSLGGPLAMQIIAAQDGTTVKLNPRDDLWATDQLAGAPAKMVTSYTLNAGEMIQWGVYKDDISGSVFESDKPVGLMTMSAELCMGSKTSPNGGGCDAAHQQIPPVSALGFDYAVAPFTTRMASMEDESIPYRLVGAVAGTTLTYEPSVPGAPSTLDVGQKVDFEAVGPFRVSSQDKGHPFFVGQHMPGGMVTGGSRPGWTVANDPQGLGDEDFLVVLAPQQYQSKYVFFSDPTYGTTNVVVTRVRGSSGFDDVNVDCLGVLSGWKPLGSSGQYEYTNADLLRSGTGACKNGQHTATSNGRFGMVVWGLDSWASYGYPAGGSVAPINDVVVPTTPN